MTLELKNTWRSVNNTLTRVNLLLFALVTGNLVTFKQVQDKKVPVAANILLMAFLGLGLFAAIYKLV